MLKEVIQDFVSSPLFICFTVLPLTNVPDASMSTPKKQCYFSTSDIQTKCPAKQSEKKERCSE